MTEKHNEIIARIKNWKKAQDSKADPILREYWRYLGNVLSNSLYRIIIAVLLFFGVIYLCYAFAVSIQQLQQSSNWIVIVFVLAISIFMFYFPLKYMWTNYNQLSYELELNKSISDLKWRIKRQTEPLAKKDYRSIQSAIMELRNNLIGYIDNSKIVSLPVSNFEVNRLKKRIDIFCNCASEALVPIDKIFSLKDKIDAKNWEEYIEIWQGEQEREEKRAKQFREETGHFENFDFYAMNEFLDHMWNVLFDREPRRYVIFSYRHPVNLILISRFFATWNEKLSYCSNCKDSYRIATEDVDEYYRTVGALQGESRQRKWKLRDDAIIILISVGLSTIIQYLVG